MPGTQIFAIYRYHLRQESYEETKKNLVQKQTVTEESMEKSEQNDEKTNKCLFWLLLQSQSQFMFTTTINGIKIRQQISSAITGPRKHPLLRNLFYCLE